MFRSGAVLGSVLALAVAAACGLAAPFGLVASARAQDGDAKRGLTVARKWCARCHVVEAGQKSQAVDAAPPFADVAGDPKMSEARLRGILLPPHGRMPTEALTRRDIDDLVAYILSQKRK